MKNFEQIPIVQSPEKYRWITSGNYSLGRYEFLLPLLFPVKGICSDQAYNWQVYYHFTLGSDEVLLTKFKEGPLVISISEGKQDLRDNWFEWLDRKISKEIKDL